jgi:hypothetical protein
MVPGRAARRFALCLRVVARRTQPLNVARVLEAALGERLDVIADGGDGDPSLPRARRTQGIGLKEPRPFLLQPAAAQAVRLVARRPGRAAMARAAGDAAGATDARRGGRHVRYTHKT